MSRAHFFPFVALLALAGCSAGSMGSSGGFAAVGPSGGPTDLATQTACRQRVNEMYDHRNRAEIYTANSSMNSPYSANYQAGVTSRGLAGQFDYERTLRECERNTGAARETARAPAAPPPKGR
ncbi:MAG: hypothetical protein EXR07_02295 [Acetobacteraceae bacterium]|nr:hypothetical protein [Acetobacteraceae bacterium]